MGTVSTALEELLVSSKTLRTSSPLPSTNWNVSDNC